MPADHHRVDTTPRHALLTLAATSLVALASGAVLITTTVCAHAQQPAAISRPSNARRVGYRRDGHQPIAVFDRKSFVIDRHCRARLRDYRSTHGWR